MPALPYVSADAMDAWKIGGFPGDSGNRLPSTHQRHCGTYSWRDKEY
jgi:hypothetical protein